LNFRPRTPNHFIVTSARSTRLKQTVPGQAGPGPVAVSALDTLIGSEGSQLTELRANIGSGMRGSTPLSSQNLPFTSNKDSAQTGKLAM
jgi:hypothetical protein